MIGLSALLIAFKYEKLDQYDIDFVRVFLGNNEFTSKKLQDMEMKILKSISFSIQEKTILDLALRKLNMLEDSSIDIKTESEGKRLK